MTEYEEGYPAPINSMELVTIDSPCYSTKIGKYVFSKEGFATCNGNEDWTRCDLKMYFKGVGWTTTLSYHRKNSNDHEWKTLFEYTERALHRAYHLGKNHRSFEIASLITPE